MSKKLIALLMATLMLLSLAAACGNQPAETPDPAPTPSEPTPAPSTDPTPAPTPTEPEKDEKYGGDLVVATNQVSGTVDPHNANNSLANYQWMQNMFEAPLATGNDGKVYPLICDYTQSDNGMIITLTIREYYFQNGEKVTIEDVLASMERAARISASFNDKHWVKVAEKTIDGDTLTLKLSEFDVTFLYDIANEAGPCYVLPKALCDKYADGTLITDEKELVGTGPYVLESYQPDTKIKLVRNENYIPTDNGDVGGPAAARMAYCDTITYAVNTDEASRTAAMIAGDYSAATIMASMGTYAQQLGLKKDMLHNQWTHAIFFNLSEENSDSIVNDVNFRKAVRACLDMDAIALSIFQGEPRYELDPNPVVKSNTAYSNDIIETTEWNIKDKELAKQYLAASGYDGEEITYLCGASSSAFYRAAMAIVPAMEEIGINVKIWTVDSGSHGALRKDPTSGHDIGAWETQKANFNPITQSTLVNGTVGWWSNDKKTELLGIMQGNPTGSDASVQAYQEFCQLVADEVPWIGLCNALTAYYTQPDVVLNYQGTSAYHWNTYFQK